MVFKINKFVSGERNKFVSGERKKSEVRPADDKVVSGDIQQKGTSRILERAGAFQGVKKEIKELFQGEQLWPYTEAILTVTLIFFFVVFAIRPTVFAITSLLGEIRSRQMLSSQMGEKIEILVTAQNSYFLVEQRVGLLDDFYPEKVNIADGAVQILGLALSNNIKISSLSFGQVIFPDKTESRGLISFTFTGVGSYQDAEQFLATLFSVRRMVQVESYSLRPKGEKEEIDPEKINISIQGKLGFFVEK